MRTTPRTDAAARSITYWCEFWKDGLVKLVAVSVSAELETELAALAARLAEVERERDNAVAFSNKVERGDVSFAKRCDEQLETIASLPLGKTGYENLSDAVSRVLAERDTLAADNERLRECFGMSSHYPLHDVLRILAAAVQHLLDDHDCDTRGHEQFRTAQFLATEYMKAISKTLSTKGGDEPCDQSETSLTTDAISNAAPENVPSVSGSRQRTLADGSFDIGTGEFIEASSPASASGNADAVRQETHVLKTDPEVFQAVKDERKTFEIRFDDRGFKVGDLLDLRETVSTGAEMKNGAPLIYTGAAELRVITHILKGPIYGIADGWVVLSMVKMMEPASGNEGTPETDADESSIMSALEGWEELCSKIERQRNAALRDRDSLRAELATLKAEIVRKDAALREIAAYTTPTGMQGGSVVNDIARAALSPTAPKEEQP